MLRPEAQFSGLRTNGHLCQMVGHHEGPVGTDGNMFPANQLNDVVDVIEDDFKSWIFIRRRQEKRQGINTYNATGRCDGFQLLIRLGTVMIKDNFGSGMICHHRSIGKETRVQCGPFAAVRGINQEVTVIQVVEQFFTEIRQAAIVTLGATAANIILIVIRQHDRTNTQFKGGRIQAEVPRQAIRRRLHIAVGDILAFGVGRAKVFGSMGDIHPGNLLRPARHRFRAPNLFRADTSHGITRPGMPGTEFLQGIGCTFRR